MVNKKNQKIVLVACVKEKQNFTRKAKDMYLGYLFPKWMSYAKNLHPDKIFILSGKYGLLNLEDEIEPYDVNLNLKSENEVKLWSKKIIEKLNLNHNLKSDNFIIIANKTYYKYLIEEITHFEIPFDIK